MYGLRCALYTLILNYMYCILLFLLSPQTDMKTWKASHKRKVPGSNPTVGKNVSFCNSRFAPLTGRVIPCKWNHPWHTPSQYLFLQQVVIYFLFLKQYNIDNNDCSLHFITAASTMDFNSCNLHMNINSINLNTFQVFQYVIGSIFKTSRFFKMIMIAIYLFVFIHWF